jgi:hypothetical protein
MNCVSQTTNCRFACVTKNWKNRDGWERERGEAELTVIARRCSSFPNECSKRQHHLEWEEQINDFFLKKTLGKHIQQRPKRKAGEKCGTGGELTGVGVALQTRLRSAYQRTGREPAGSRGEKGMQTTRPA